MSLDEKAHTLALCQRLLDDRTESDLLFETCSSDLFTIDARDFRVSVCESSEAESWRARQYNNEDDFLQALLAWEPTQPDRSTIFIIPQIDSRSRLMITRNGFERLALKLRAFPALARLAETFTPDDTDFYLSGGRVHFGRRSVGEWDREKVLEMSCLLRHVEKNGRAEGVQGWSIRTMGAHHSYNTNSCAESLTLINPSTRARVLLQGHLKTAQDTARPWLHWSFMPLLLFRSITSGWAGYIRELHREVHELMSDSRFLGDSTDKEELREEDGLVTGSMIVSAGKIQQIAFLEDRIQYAMHALRINRNTLDAFLAEAAHRHQTLPETFRIEMESLQLGVEDVRRELSFNEQQLEIVRFRLQQTQSCYRDVANMQDSQNMQRMTIKSIREAYAVRLIALVTFLFLPPTFTCGFFEMQYVNVNTNASGALSVSATPGLLFWAEITIPLMLVTVLVWFYFDHRIRRSRRAALAKQDPFQV